jgi:hypothetical protein
MDRITVDVLMVEGVGPEARAHVQNVDERGLPIRVLASRVREHFIDQFPESNPDADPEERDDSTASGLRGADGCG